MSNFHKMLLFKLDIFELYNYSFWVYNSHSYSIRVTQCTRKEAF